MRLLHGSLGRVRRRTAALFSRLRGVLVRLVHGCEASSSVDKSEAERTSQTMLRSASDEEERKRAEQEEEKKRRRRRAIDAIVDTFIADRLVNIPLIPDFVERNIYAVLLRVVLRKTEALLVDPDTDVRFMGMRLHVHLDPVSGLEGALSDSCTNTVYDDGCDDDDEDEDTRRIREEDRRFNDATIHGLTQRFADVTQSDDTLSCFFGSNVIEQNIYKNTISMCMGVLRVVLKRCSVEILGQRVTFAVRAVPYLPYCVSGSESASAESTCDDADDDEDDPMWVIVSDIVEEMMHESEHRFFIPDFIERYLYGRAVRILIAVIQEGLASTNVTVLGHRSTFDLHPSAASSTSGTDGQGR